MSAEAFKRLDAALPLALLPVRLEARYSGTNLVVRVFPDALHADGHAEALTERERSAGEAYWRAVWGVTDAAASTSAREWLARRCGPYRALWVARETAPLNDPADGEPQFPEGELRAADEPVRASLLPDQWMVRLYDDRLQLAQTAFSAPVVPEPAIAPRLAAVDLGAEEDPLDAFLHGQGLAWLTDVQAAVDTGMAVRIPIGVVPNPVGAVLVLGVRAERDPLAEASALDDLLDAHWYTDGLDVVPQGTPTNNTDAGRSGISVDSPDMDELFERDIFERPIAPAGRAVLMAADPALMLRLPAADTLSLALGRVRANPLDRVVNAESGDGAAAWAMNLAIGYVTLGDYIDGPLAMIDGRIAPGPWNAALRDWYVDWVRGAGALPAIRCGAIPYGLLPITSEPVATAAPAGFHDLLEANLVTAMGTWDASLPAAALDPTAADARPSVSAQADAAVVGEVLGAVPHPTSVQLRLATDHTDEDRARFTELMAEIDYELTRDQGGLTWANMVTTWKETKPLIDGIPTNEVPHARPPDIYTQLATLQGFRDELAPVADELSYGAEALAAIDDLLPLLEMHRDATDRIPPPLDGWSRDGGIGSDAVIRLVHTTFDVDAAPAGPLVGDLAALDALLASLVAALDDPPAPEDRTPLVTGEAPLLHHLLDCNAMQVPADQAPAVRAALVLLRGRIDDAGADATFDRLVRESLGLGTHRVDAWVTSIAAERLASKRHAVPAGIQVGAYGWLLDLAPSPDPPSQGFIHAPSLSHAATAAVLRSGWSAFGTDSGETPLSIDLSSRRVRGASWILDGVRNGQDLSEVLGARFERYLHDSHLDLWIETVRQAALDATGTPRPASAIVDGLLVARAWSDVEATDAEKALHAELMARTSPPSDPEHRAVRAQLGRLAADLDSVADLLMAQSVHSLLRGNSDAAAGALAITGGGDAAVPPITVTDGPRASQLVSHRVVAAWPGAPSAPADGSVLTVAEPRLSAWLASLLPSPADVSAGAITLADVGLTAVEAAHLAGAAATQDGSRLGRIVVAAGGELGAGALSVNDFGLLAGAAMDAVGRARALRPEDLAVPGADVSGAVAGDAELAGRVAGVEGLLAELSSALAADDAETVRGALLRCATIDVPGAVVALEAPGDAAALATVQAALADRRLPAVEPVTDEERLRALVAGALPILPTFTPAPDPQRAVSAAYEPRATAVAQGAGAWLRQAGRARTALGAINDALLLAEAVAGRPLTTYGLVQLPQHEEGWAAVEKPEGQRERLTVLSLTGADALTAEGQPIAGLLIDGWAEGIPRADQVTGIAVHFDAPTARAPDAVLLSVVDDERGFSAGELSDQLLATLHLAKLRAIPPTGLARDGQYLPTVFLPDTIEVPAT